MKNLADYTVDNTGATLVTSKIQSAINALSGTQNILYVPPGKYKVGDKTEERRFLLRCELDAAFFHFYLPTHSNEDWCPTDRESRSGRGRPGADSLDRHV